MAMNHVWGNDKKFIEAYAHLFQAFAEPARLAILQHLTLGEHRVRELVDHLGLAQSTVSKHLKFLVECGLITARPQGRSTWYALADPDALQTLIVAAERMVHAAGPHTQPVHELEAELEVT